jgi:hypothetical protein
VRISSGKSPTTALTCDHAARIGDSSVVRRLTVQSIVWGVVSTARFVEEKLPLSVPIERN